MRGRKTTGCLGIPPAASASCPDFCIRSHSSRKPHSRRIISNKRSQLAGSGIKGGRAQNQILVGSKRFIGHQAVSGINSIILLEHTLCCIPSLFQLGLENSGRLIAMDLAFFDRLQARGGVQSGQRIVLPSPNRSTV